jgi:ribosomal protein L7/L12
MTFKYEKVKDLFGRITEKCSRDDISRLADEINTILGRTFRKNEFYYTGFGGRKVGAEKSDDSSEEDAVTAVAAPVARTTVDLKLTGYDDTSKIKVIKEVRAIAGLGLKEAKELVESAPKVIQKDLKPDQAEELKKKLEAVGAQIELV